MKLSGSNLKTSQRHQPGNETWKECKMMRQHYEKWGYKIHFFSPYAITENEAMRDIMLLTRKH